MSRDAIWPAFFALVRKDLVLYLTNRRAMVVSLVAPIVIAAFFGAVFGSGTGRPSRIPIAVADRDGGAVSGRIVDALAADPALRVERLDEAAARARVGSGEVRAAVVLPRGFGSEATAALLGGGAKPRVDVVVDPSQTAVPAIVRGVLAQHAMEAIGRSLSGGGASASAPGAAFALPFVTRVSEQTGPARPYNGYAHAFAGMGVQFILFMGIEAGVGVLLARRLGLWKRLRAAPLSRALLLGSHLASSTIIAFALLAAIYAAAIVAFGVRVDGSVAGFVGVMAGFALLTSTFGLLVAAIGRTPEATRGLAIFATLLMVMLGGAWVPSFVFPEWLQQAALVDPARWAVDGLDAMTWRGLGFAAAVGPIVALLGFSAAFAAIALWRFDWSEPH